MLLQDLGTLSFRTVLVVIGVSGYSPSAFSAGADAATIAELKADLEELKAQQHELDTKVARIESVLAHLSSSSNEIEEVQAIAMTTPFWSMSGDVRLRYEGNNGGTELANRSRGVVRGRLRASAQVVPRVRIGGQLVSGDTNDPNTVDVTLDNFFDDINVSLDQIYVHADLGDIQLWGGKFPQIYERTDLLWDGDLSLQGVGARYEPDLPGSLAVTMNTTYLLIDEAPTGSDSYMAGAQLAAMYRIDDYLTGDLSFGFFDYQLGSVSGADAGDFRSNRLAADGSYLSDFNLLNLIANLEYSGFGARWPVGLSAESVENLGAVTGENQGFGLSLRWGAFSEMNPWRFGYGYSETDREAVFAAFSHDNLNLATNYQLHSLSVDYRLTEAMELNATFYRYRPDSIDDLTAPAFADWQNRFRLNLLSKF